MIMSRILLVVFKVLIVLLSIFGVMRPKLVCGGLSDAMLRSCYNYWCYCKISLDSTVVGAICSAFPVSTK